MSNFQKRYLARNFSNMTDIFSVKEHKTFSQLLNSLCCREREFLRFSFTDCQASWRLSLFTLSFKHSYNRKICSFLIIPSLLPCKTKSLFRPAIHYVVFSRQACPYSFYAMRSPSPNHFSSFSFSLSTYNRYSFSQYDVHHGILSFPYSNRRTKSLHLPQTA